jgi:hypothetical protein
MIYSYTQISQYLSCPRRYKHRYLDGWKEKDTRAAMMFGQAFEQAVAAYFQRMDAAVALFQEWSAHRDSGLHYSERNNWDRMLQSGSIETGRSIKSILRQGRFFAPSNPTASSAGSLPSMESFGMPLEPCHSK